MKSARILIIEDDETLRRAVGDLLSDQAWQIETAADGQIGYDRAMEGRFDLILLDLMLPHIDGYEICRSLRLQSISTPVLMLTAIPESPAMNSATAASLTAIRGASPSAGNAWS
ncbi:MAG: response regulator [Luteolibacter sp.]